MYWKLTCINCDIIAPQFFFLFLGKLILSVGYLFMFVFWGKETGTQCYLKVMEYFVLKEEII